MPTLVAPVGVASIARNSAGNYTITFPRPYVRLCLGGHLWIAATGAYLFPRVTDVSNLSATAATITVEPVTEAGTATDPTSGHELILTLGAYTDNLNQSNVTV